MRKIVLAFVMAVIPAFVAFSQDVSSVQIMASGGVSMPFSSNDCSVYYATNQRLSAITLPPFKYSSSFTTGFHFGFGLGYPVMTNMLAVLDLNYNSSNLDKTAFLKDIGLTGSEYMDDVVLKMVSINANLKYVIPQTGLFFDPYVTVGAGYMGIGGDDLSIVAGENSVIAAQFKSQDALNTAVGVGVDIRSSESSSFFIELKYDVSYTRSSSPFSSDNFVVLPIRVGIRGSI